MILFALFTSWLLLVAEQLTEALPNGYPSGKAEGDVQLTEQKLSDLKFYAQYSVAALCNSDTPPDDIITCNGGCPALENNNVTIEGTVRGLLWDLHGFVAIDHARLETVGVLRATASARNLFADALLLQTDCTLTPGCKVHTGFAEAWNEVSDSFKKLLSHARTKYPTYRTTLQGYSLGGSTAVLAGAYLRQEGYKNLDIYTYGAPRVGNTAFVSHVMAQEGAEYRVTHYQDLAPTYVPLFLGYRHTFPEYWLAPGPSTRISYDVQDVEVCNGKTQRQCNSATFNLDIVSHLYYFQPTLRCFPFTVRRDETLETINTVQNTSFLERMQLGRRKMKIWLFSFTDI